MKRHLKQVTSPLLCGLRSFPILHWFQDKSIRELFKNVGLLLSGDGTARVLGLGSLVLTTRALGAEGFGLLVLANTYARVLDRLFNFQSWQAIIKYGAEALDSKRYEDFKGIIKLGTLLDASSAVFGSLIAVSAAYWTAKWFGWSQETAHMAALYSLVILFNLSGTPTGVIRLFERFGLLATQRVIVAVLKLFAIGAAYFSDASLWAYVLIWMICDIVGHVILLVMGYVLLYRKEIGKWWKSPISNWRSFSSFVFWTNLSSTFDIPVKQLDVFIVSAVVSLEGVGIYKVFKSIADILTKPVDPVYQAIYPQFATLVTKGEDARAARMAAKVGLIILVVSIPTVILMSLSSQWWLSVIFGDTFASQWLVMNLYLTFKALSISAVAVHPLFIAMGYVQKNFVILATANIIFLILAWFLCGQFGLAGIILAYGVQFSGVVISKLWCIWAKMRRTPSLAH